VGLGPLERACELNNATACSTLAYAWRDGRHPDPEKARGYAAKACALGHAESCG
jgi:TPR repeat protein